MKNRSLTTFLAALLMVFLFACDKEEQDVQKQLKLESIGFAGTLPDGRTFGKTGIVDRNGQASSSSTNEGSSITHVLSIFDSVAGIYIKVDLPHLKYSDGFNAGYEGDSIIEGNGATTRKIAREFYPYQMVKEKLAVGSKLLISSQIPYSTNAFRVQVNDNINYHNFICDAGDQTDSYLKVVELVEGTETDPTLGQVKTLEVVFELDVKMYHANEPRPTPPSKLKGLLRMKYREV